jgi:hypothetical protein
MHATTKKRTAFRRDGDGDIDKGRERVESRELYDEGLDGGVGSVGNEVRDRGNVPELHLREIQ